MDHQHTVTTVALRSTSKNLQERGPITGRALLGLDQIVMQTGLTVRMQRVSLAPIAAEVAQMLRGYDAGLAPAEIHRALFDPMSGDLIAEPKRLWKGVIDTAPIHTAEIGGQSTVDVALASAARALTRGAGLCDSGSSHAWGMNPRSASCWP